MLTKRDVRFYSKKFTYYNQKTTREQKKSIGLPLWFIWKYCKIPTDVTYVYDLVVCHIFVSEWERQFSYLWLTASIVWVFILYKCLYADIIILWDPYVFFFFLSKISSHKHTHTQKHKNIWQHWGDYLTCFFFWNAPSLLETQQTHWSVTRFLPGRQFTRIILGYRVEFYG